MLTTTPDSIADVWFGPLLSARVPVLGAVAFVALGAMVSCGGRGDNRAIVRELTVQETTQLDAGSAERVLRYVYYKSAAQGKILELYSIGRNVATGRITEETEWLSSEPSKFLDRDWTTCMMTDNEPPRPVLARVSDLLSDMIGPRVIPADAHRLGPNLWQFSLNSLEYIRIQTEKSGGYLSRIAYYGVTGSAPSDTVRIVGVRNVSRVPSPISNWRSCRATAAVQSSNGHSGAEQGSR